MKKHYLRFLCVGVGGMYCSCCFQPPGKRKEEFRKAKRREKREAMRIERGDPDMVHRI